MKTKSTILRFLNNIEIDSDHRYTSWENCYKAFQKNNNRETLSIHLAFYLASWGMYRGSSGLLQKNYKVHDGAVDIILDYKHLQCSSSFEISRNNIKDLNGLIKELEKYYGSISFTRNYKNYKINPTITLITKVIMGTLGCLPAFDRYFLHGVKQEDYCFINLSEFCLEYLFHFVENIEYNEICECQNLLNEKREMFYPKMKIVDMYFWQLGYDDIFSK